MYDLLEYKGWIIVGVFLFLFGLERLKPAISLPLKIKDHAISRIFKNLGFWPLNMLLSLSIVLPVSAYASQWALWDRNSSILPSYINGWEMVFLDILILDLFIFWWHRTVHSIQFLWRFHEIHHLDEHLDTTSALRFHFIEIFFSIFARALVIIICAIPFYSVVIFEILVMSASFFHHSNIKFPSRFESILSKIIVTPSLHWVHHHAIRKDTDSNYGTILSVWDRLFSTKSPTKRYKGMKIGVEKMEDTTFLRLLVRPFLPRS